MLNASACVSVGLCVGAGARVGGSSVGDVALAIAFAQKFARST